MTADEAESLFAEVAATRSRYVWLDGGGAHAWAGSRSVLAWCDPDDVSLTYDAGAREVTRHAGGRAEVVGDDVLDVLEGELAAAGPGEQWFGYLGYAARPDLPALVARAAAAGGGRVPDAVWMRPSHVRVVDHGALPAEPTGRVPQDAAGTGVGHTTPTASGQDGAAQQHAQKHAQQHAQQYAAAYARVQEHLHAGNTYEVNLTYREQVRADLDPVEVYHRLRAPVPAPYAGFLAHDVDDAVAPGARAWLLSGSPERYALVRVEDDGERTLETRPIKGTTPRDPDPALDDELARRLATEQRYRAENLMIVDLLRHDLALVCRPGTVVVPQLMGVETYPAVHQLVSTVRGTVRPEISTVAALRALFPAGSMTGAPKQRTMQVVAEVEATPRGPYAGAFGWIGGDGGADLGVVIRSLVTSGDGRWELATGGGVTVHSTLAEEWAEAGWKAARVALGPPRLSPGGQWLLWAGSLRGVSAGASDGPATEVRSPTSAGGVARPGRPSTKRAPPPGASATSTVPA